MESLILICDLGNSRLAKVIDCDHNPLFLSMKHMVRLDQKNGDRREMGKKALAHVNDKWSNPRQG
jgi:hypothetical protein